MDTGKLYFVKDEFYERGIKEGWFGKEFEMPESIVPEIYGIIDKKLDGTLFTTKAQRTGCSMCGFGIHMESRPHRFDLLRERNEKEWHFWMYDVCTDENGNHFGWGKVLDYIREHLDQCTIYDLTFVSDLEPEAAVTEDDIVMVYDEED